MAQIKIKNSSLSIDAKLHNGNVTYGWKNQVVNKSLQQKYGSTEIQFNGWENPAFNLVFHIPQGATATGFLSWSDWNKIVRNKPTDSSKTYLEITTSKGNVAYPFTSYALSSTSLGTSSIPVVVKDFNTAFSASDSSGAYFWTINANLLETK